MNCRTTLQRIVTASVLVLGVAASAGLQARTPTDNLPLRCTGPGCGKIASVVAWPEERLDGGTVPFLVQGAFTVRLPKDPAEFVLHADSGLTARYADGRWIGVQIMRATASKLLPAGTARDTRSDALSFSDLPRILYTKTPADSEPAHAQDRQLWRLALVHKNATLERATQVQVAERGPLTAYFADSGAAHTTGDLQVVHRRIKDSYLFVQVKGFSFDDVRRVVGSMEAKRE